MDFSRQMEVFNPETFNQPVHIIGCGATGSWVAMLVAKLGIKNIHLHDFDIVEEHNLPNQAFYAYTDIPYHESTGNGQVGVSKVTACKDNMYWFAKTEATEHNEKVTGETPLSGIVFLLTDTMSSRADIFKNALKNNLGCPLVVETRMGMESGRVYAFDPSNQKQAKAYAQTLYSDEESVVSSCGIAQSLAPTAAYIASLAVWQLIKWHNEFPIENEIIVDIKGNTYLTRSF